MRAQCLHETGHGTGSVMKDQDNAKTLPDFPGSFFYINKIWVYVWYDGMYYITFVFELKRNVELIQYK